MAVAGDLEEELAAEFAALFPHLDERQRRLWLGAGGWLELGLAGSLIVAEATGVAADTVPPGPCRGSRDAGPG